MNPFTVDREYICTGQFTVVATDPTTAQQAMQAAEAAVHATLAGLDPDTPVSLSLEDEDGQYVFSQP